VHGLPADEVHVVAAQGDLAFAGHLADAFGVLDERIAECKVLCPREKMELAESLSVKVMVIDGDAVEHTVSSGVFLWGAHVCVSRYQPRTKRRMNLHTAVYPPCLANSLDWK
jgi:hypothetical protein